ncbi:hypothetical protein BpHYR1_028014 [Brachionus plicatilis]|uniref:Uncharacterized protein n=1 Tax=Brachionus plicatilis TaxID=10195 RepID=A0A3M7RL68_BRAPC|nr:hypothetical protein BpHYR1_028014 [Brachionus plicatilis]
MKKIKEQESVFDLINYLPYLIDQKQFFKYNSKFYIEEILITRNPKIKLVFDFFSKSEGA